MSVHNWVYLEFYVGYTISSSLSYELIYFRVLLYDVILGDVNPLVRTYSLEKLEGRSSDQAVMFF